MKKQRVEADYYSFYEALCDEDVPRFRALLKLPPVSRKPICFLSVGFMACVEENVDAISACIDFYVSEDGPAILSGSHGSDFFFYLRHISANYPYLQNEILANLKYLNDLRREIYRAKQHHRIPDLWFYVFCNMNPKESYRPARFESMWLNWKPSRTEIARTLSFAFDEHLVALLSCLGHLHKDMRRLISQQFARLWWHQFPDPKVKRKLKF